MSSAELDLDLQALSKGATAERLEAWERAAALGGKDPGEWALEVLDEWAAAVLDRVVADSGAPWERSSTS